MSQQKTTRLYWKDALRQVQISLDDETAAVRQHKWASAFYQAQADLEDPSAIVWLPDEITTLISEGVIRQSHPVQETPPAQTRRSPHPPKPRRLPAPQIPAALRPLPPRQPGPPPVDNPYVTKIAHLLEQMATVSGLSPYVLLRDWLDMLESGLKMWPAYAVQRNFRKMSFSSVSLEKVHIVV